MNKTKSILILLALFIAIKSFGQQEALYTQYMSNPLIINPAYAGTLDKAVITGLFRKQWVGIEGSPQTSTISFQSPISAYDFGIGGHLIFNSIGPVTQTGLYFDYSYMLSLNGYGTLSMGLDGGLIYYHVNTRDLTHNDPDEDLDNSDPTSLFYPNFGLGCFYYTDNYYAGFSVPKLLKHTIANGSVNVENENREELYYFLIGGGTIPINQDIDIEPSIIARMSMKSPISVDISGVLVLYEKFSFGLNYRFGESFGAIAKWNFPFGLEIGYSYDYAYSEFGNANYGSHEILISYYFQNNKRRHRPQRYYKPRRH